MKLFFDGGCRPLPAGMETAVVVAGRCFVQQAIGPGTSLEAEWLALIHAATLAIELGVARPLFLGDSLAVINQASGRAKCRGMAADHRAAFQAIAAPFAPLRLRHIKRTQNLAGIALARLHG